MNRRFVLAVLVGCLAIFVAMNMGPKKPAPQTEKPAEAPKPAKAVAIFRATANLKEKTEITAEMFKRFDTFDTDEAWIQLGGKGITSEASLIGKETIKKIRISEPFTYDNVLDKKPFVPKRLSEAVPEGKRAVTIAVNVTQSVGGFVREGDFVDIVGIFSDPGVSMPIRTILSGVQVLSIGSELPTSPTDNIAVTPNPKDPNAPPMTSIKATPVQQITFAATPEEAEIITLVSQSRNKISFYLLLRSKSEMEEKMNKAKQKAQILQGQTKEVAIEGQTKEVVIGGEMLTKKEALEIFYGKPTSAQAQKLKLDAAAMSQMDPSDPNFNPDKMYESGPEGQKLQPRTFQKPGANPSQPVENTIEMFKGTSKTVINVK